MAELKLNLLMKSADTQKTKWLIFFLVSQDINSSSHMLPQSIQMTYKLNGNMSTVKF